MDDDYPRTLRTLESRFSTEADCRKYLASIRWPDGFVCPSCGGREWWETVRGLMVCKGCERQTSVTAGTIFHGTRVALPTWFRAIWWVMSQKNGASALGLKRVLGLGSYRTAWMMMHKLRRAMVCPGRGKLKGRIEIDEAFVGGLEEGVRGRQTEKKALIAVAAEVRGAAIGRIRMRRIPDASARSLHGFVTEVVEPGSTLHTDDWLGYSGVEALGYEREITTIGSDKKRAGSHFPRVHRVTSLLKRWLLGTHQGAVCKEHLNSYLDEFVFRFNRRTSASRGKLFRRLLENAVRVDPVPYADIAMHLRPGRPPSPNHKM
jgi:hypothetical protein